jgi:hypothetical protein
MKSFGSNSECELKRRIGMGTRVRSSIVLLAFVVCVCSASARVIGAQAPARQPSVTTDVVYGHKDGLALTLDVHRSAHPNGAGVISIVSGGWQSSVELAQIFTQAYPPFIEKGFTVFAVRHGSWPRYPMSAIVADMRRSVRFIRQHAKEYGVDPDRLGVFGGSRRAARAAARYDRQLRGSVGRRRRAQGIQSRRGHTLTRNARSPVECSWHSTTGC